VKKKWCREGSHSSSVSGSNHLRRRRRRRRRRRKRKKNILAVWQLSGLVLSRCFLAPLGVLFVMKTFKDEW